MTVKRKVIVIAGFTAAGKTTHGRLLAESFGLPYYSASAVLRRFAREVHDVPDSWGERWHPGVDMVRADPSLDKQVDEFMLELLSDAESGVFDACFLPWVYDRSDVVKMWIQSDFDSRVRKCYVSHLDNSRISLQDAAVVVREKDSITRKVLQDSLGMAYEADERFDLVVSNSDLIPAATVAAAVHGVGIFSQLVQRCVEYLFDSWATAPSDPRIVHIA